MRFVATVSAVALTTAALAVAVPDGVGPAQRRRRGRLFGARNVGCRDPRCRRRWPRSSPPSSSGWPGTVATTCSPDLLRRRGPYTRSSAFPGQFAQANRIVHRWMFTDSVQQTDESGRWEIDLSPMLSDRLVPGHVAGLRHPAPVTVAVPLTENVSDALRPGQLRQLTRWGPWASVGAMVLTGVLALLVLAAARSRGKALASLGVSALLVGAAGWAGIEVGAALPRRRPRPDHR